MDMAGIGLLNFGTTLDLCQRIKRAQKDDSLYLPYRDRLQLSVVISSSVLQLQGSPWLPDILSSRDIFFIKKQGYPIYNHPFIMRKLPGDDPGPAESEPGAPFICNPTLLSLGVLLIELILGGTLDSLRTPQEFALTSSDLLVDYITAQRLVDKVRMASSNYGTAVTRCISGDLHRDGGSMDTEGFCQDVYSGVVALLEKDLENS